MPKLNAVFVRDQYSVRRERGAWGNNMRKTRKIYLTGRSDAIADSNWMLFNVSNAKLRSWHPMACLQCRAHRAALNYRASTQYEGQYFATIYHKLKIYFRSPLLLNLLVNRDVNEPEEWWQKEAKPKEKNKPLKITLVVQVRKNWSLEYYFLTFLYG